VRSKITRIIYKVNILTHSHCLQNCVATELLHSWSWKVLNHLQRHLSTPGSCGDCYRCRRSPMSCCGPESHWPALLTPTSSLAVRAYSRLASPSHSCLLELHIMVVPAKWRGSSPVLPLRFQINEHSPGVQLSWGGPGTMRCIFFLAPAN
jgi:hypothetical protein